MLRIYRKTASLWRIRKSGSHGISIKNISVIPRRGIGLTSGPKAMGPARPVALEDGTFASPSDSCLKYPFS